MGLQAAGGWCPDQAAERAFSAWLCGLTKCKPFRRANTQVTRYKDAPWSGRGFREARAWLLAYRCCYNVTRLHHQVQTCPVPAQWWRYSVEVGLVIPLPRTAFSDLATRWGQVTITKTLPDQGVGSGRLELDS
eukprot:355603-Chlamydomonas_euryale.AAC.2